MANTPIETIEASQPLLIRRYGFVPDTGGPGRFRGGLGLVREYEVTHDEATLQIRSDRARFLPWGTQGGSPGSAGANLLNPDRADGGERLPGKFLRTLERGDVYRLVQPGGGGYGDPLGPRPTRRCGRTPHRARSPPLTRATPTAWSWTRPAASTRARPPRCGSASRVTGDRSSPSRVSCAPWKDPSVHGDGPAG